MGLMETLALTSMSLNDWFALLEDEPGELVDGQLVEEEVPSCIHELLAVQLAVLFHSWIFARGGLVLGSETKLAVAPARGRKPDLCVYLPGRRPPARALVKVPPDIAVEIVSPTPRDVRRDRVEKMDEYAAFGIRHYWVVDPERRAVEIFALARGRYARALAATTGVIEQVPGCPGMRLDLDAMWAAAARLDGEPAGAADMVRGR